MIISPVYKRDHTLSVQVSPTCTTIKLTYELTYEAPHSALPREAAGVPHMTTRATQQEMPVRYITDETNM